MIGQTSLFAPEATLPLRKRVEVARVELADIRGILTRCHYLGRARTGRQLNYAVSLDGVVDGAITYAYPMMSADLCGVPSDQVLEFARLFLASNVPHVASCAIGQTLRRVARDWRLAFPEAPPVQLVVSWSDTEYHVGTVYRAANFAWLRRCRGTPPGNAATSKREDQARRLSPRQRLLDLLVGPEEAKEVTESPELTLTAPGPAPMPREFPLVLRVEWDPNLLSANRTQEHWRVTHKKKVAARRQFGLAYDAAGRPVWNVPVVVDVVIRRARRLDETNARGALKCGEDVLFKNAITPDDKPAWVAWGTVRQEIAGKWSGREECELTVWPREVLERREQALEEVLAAADAWRTAGYPRGVTLAECRLWERLDNALEDARSLGWRPNKGDTDEA